MKVLLVNQYFPPDNSATAAVYLDLVTALRDAGHSVTVLTGRPSYEPSDRVRWRPVRASDVDGIKVVTVGSSAFSRASLVARAANYISYLFAAVLRSLREADFDVVIAGSDPPLAVLPALIAARRTPLAYALQDLHPDAATSAGLMRRSMVTAVWDGLHSWAMRRCAVVVCLSETMSARVVSKGVDPSRVRVIPTGASPPTAPIDLGVVSSLRKDASFCVIHAGNIGSSLPLECLAGTQELLPEVRFLFVGDGVQAGEARRLGLEVRPFLDESLIPSVMAAGDVQLVALKDEMAGLVVPSKLFTALGHGRPVIAVVPEESEVAKLVRGYECGFVADPEKEEIARELKKGLHDPELLARFAENAAQAGAAMSRARSVSDWVSLIQTLS